jgi:hypothetical protein
MNGWVVELRKALRVPYGTEKRERTIMPGTYTMKEMRGGYRLSAPGCGFFKRSRNEIDALISDKSLYITTGNWPL